MSHTESSVMRLNKENLVRMLLDYQQRFNNILDKLNNNLDQLKTKFCKFISDLHISRSVNDIIFDRLEFLEKKCHTNEQYPWIDFLKNYAFLLTWGIRTLKKKCWGFCMQSTSC